MQFWVNPLFLTPGSPDCENFILTKCDGSITDSSPLFGLDSEMCLTSKGEELTCISVVAEEGHCIMDELVKPDFKILDYLTSFSGITKKILNPMTTKLKDAQKLLRELLTPDAVLVDHSLDFGSQSIERRTHSAQTSLVMIS